MRFFLTLTVSGALLASGCSKQSQPAQTSQEPELNAANTASGKPAFRNRASVAPSAAESPVAATDPSRPVTKPSPLAALAERQQALAQSRPALPEIAVVVDPRAPPVNPDHLPQEGDQIMVPINLLGVLLPGVNLDTITRKEPMNVKNLLDERGFVVTNYQQLIEMGITNYQIVRAQKPVTAGVAK